MAEFLIWIYNISHELFKFFCFRESTRFFAVECLFSINEYCKRAIDLAGAEHNAVYIINKSGEQFLRKIGRA